MKKITYYLISIVVLVSFFYSSAAFSIPGYRELPGAWTHVASACSPDESAIDKYLFSNGDFTFKSDTYSDSSSFFPFVMLPIVVRCNVVNVNVAGADDYPSWNAFVIGYIDPDGVGADTQIIARIYQLNRLTGTLTSIGVFNSNNANQLSRGESWIPISNVFDFSNAEYFVQLELYRKSLVSINPAVYSVRLAVAIRNPV